jgi:thiol:disulfide interchange protein DsbD
MVYFPTMRRLAAFTVIWIFGCAWTVCAQGSMESPVHWSATSPGRPVKPGEVFEVKIEASIDGEWHLYSATQPPGGPNPTRFSLLSGDPFQIAGLIRQTPPTTQFDANFGIQTEFFSTGADFWIPLKAAAGAKPGDYDARLQVVFQVCNDQVCLPPTKVPLPFKVKVIAGASSPGGSSAPEMTQASTQEKAAVVAAQKPAEQSQSAAAKSEGTDVNPPSAAEPVRAVQPAQGSLPVGTAAEVQHARSSGFWPFLWLAMTMGAVSLATPCVFPMIPITVSYFTKSAETRKGSGISLALVYCFGIIFTFTGLGLGLAALLGATGINQFAANPWVNLLITAIFLGFALNLFGLYQIGVPSSVLTRLSKAGGEGGYIQALLMGLTFTLTSFTCTVPFVGTVLVATSQGDWLWPALGMLGFSVVFASPFFALALLPQLLTSLPRSGGWLNSVKVTMGFLEVAAAMKFVSNVDLVWHWKIFTREVVLAIWLAIAVMAAIYLLGKFRLPHDGPIESLGVVRMLWTIFFLALAFYLFTGLIGGSLGELDAFLPPRTSGEHMITGGGIRGQELTWHTTLDSALEEARQQQKLIFVDFTGYTCTNCRWMEANIFPLPEVHSRLEKFVRLQLYTDGAGKQYDDNQRYQKEKFETVALPLYAILDSQGTRIATFPGMTRKPEEFIRFLNSPFARP